MAEEYAAEAKQLIIEELPPQWVLLVDLRQWDYCPPEVWEYFNGVYEWYADHGMIAEGIVSTRKMINHFVTQLDKYRPIPCGQFFSEDYEEVRQWCRDQLNSYKRSSNG